MNCDEFERLLQTTVEERLSSDQPALREHAADCEACGCLWEQAVLLEEAIPVWRSRLSRADLADAVLGRLAQQAGVLEHDEPRRPPAADRPVCVVAVSRETPVSRWPAVAGVAAAAAVLLLLVLPLPRPAPRFEPGPDGPAVAIAPPLPLELPKVPVEPVEEEAAVAGTERPFDDALREARDAWLSLARDTQGALSQARLLVPAPGLVLADATPEEMAPAGRSDWRRELRRELRPIRHGLQDTIDFLLDAVADEAPAT